MKIQVKGPIVPNSDAWIYEFFGMEYTSAKNINEALEKANGEDIEVEINSGGGSVFAGSEIYSALKSYTGNVTVKIVGLAASAASVIAMAGKKIMMSPTSQLMLHNCSAFSEGDHKEMSKTSEILKTIDKTISNAYMIKTGKTQGEVLKLMDKETWLSPEDAKQHGFIDEVMFEQEILFVASANFSGLLSQETLTKVRNLMADKENKTRVKKAETKLRFMKLKGEV